MTAILSIKLPFVASFGFVSAKNYILKNLCNRYL